MRNRTVYSGALSVISNGWKSGSFKSRTTMGSSPWLFD